MSEADFNAVRAALGELLFLLPRVPAPETYRAEERYERASEALERIRKKLLECQPEAKP